MNIKEDPSNNTVTGETAASTVPPKIQLAIVAGILLLAIFLATLLFVFKPKAEKLAVKDEPPLAEFVLAKYVDIPIPVTSQGNIAAKTNIKLVAEVSGRVTQMAQLKLNGGFFKKGEPLLSIDDTDYRLAITKARAQVSSAQQQLARVKTEAEQARFDLKQIGRDPSSSTDYALRKPHLAEARANLQAAKADQEIAELQLSRTQVNAPFDGRVVKKQVDIGQYVTPGTLLADIYSTETVEIRLPVSLKETELLGLGLRNEQSQIDSIKVTLTSEYSGRNFQWNAKLSHTEGELDARNRQVYAVAEIDDPYKKDEADPGRPPLTPGMFVKAKLIGVPRKNVIVLAREALRHGGEVWLIDEKSKLQRQKIELYSKDRYFIYIKSGLKNNDRVIINAINFPVNGMPVSPVKTNDVDFRIEVNNIHKSENE